MYEFSFIIIIDPTLVTAYSLHRGFLNLRNRSLRSTELRWPSHIWAWVSHVSHDVAWDLWVPSIVILIQRPLMLLDLLIGLLFAVLWVLVCPVWTKGCDYVVHEIGRGIGARRGHRRALIVAAENVLSLGVLNWFLISKGFVLDILFEFVSFTLVLLSVENVLWSLLVIRYDQILLIIYFKLLVSTLKHAWVLQVNFVQRIMVSILIRVLLLLSVLLIFMLDVVLNVLSLITVPGLVPWWYFALQVTTFVLGSYYDLLVVDFLNLLCFVKLVDSSFLRVLGLRYDLFLFVLKCYFSKLRSAELAFSLRPCSSWVMWQAMVAWNLQFTVFYVEFLDELLEHIHGLSHELLSLLLWHDLRQEYVWRLEVGEQKDKYFKDVSWDLHQEDGTVNVVKVSVKHLSFGVNSISLMVLEGHGRWSSLSYYVYLIFGWICESWLTA